MKKLVCFICTLITILCGTIIVSANDTVDVYVNGEKLVTDQPAIIYQDRTMVPLRAICEALNCEVEWDNSTRTAIIENELTIIAVQIDNYILSIKDRRFESNEAKKIPIDVPPILYNDRVLVPARAISEALHAKVEWDGYYNRVDINLEYDLIYYYSENLAAVKKNNKWGFVNKNGEIVLPIEYDDAWIFSEGLAPVGKNGKYGFIDENGGMVIDFIYDYAYPFNENLSCVAVGSKWGFINKNGTVVIPIYYDDAFTFENGLAGIGKEINGKYKYGFIGPNNKVIIPLEYEDVWPFASEPDWPSDYKFAPVKRNGKWGAINDKNETVIDFIYDDVGGFGIDYLSFYKYGEEIYISYDEIYDKLKRMK